MSSLVGGVSMPNIKPIDIEEYGKQQTTIKLLTKLNKAEEAIKTGDEWQTLDDLKRRLGV